MRLEQRCVSFALGLLFAIAAVACSSGEAQKNTNTAAAAPGSAADAKPAGTPARNFSASDVAKLKWLEGSWRGMDGDKPFYERYTFEGTTMVVETLKEDGSPDGEPGRFELKDGEFGKGDGDKRSAASSITESSVQFVPGPQAKGNSFRFEKKPHGWDAILEWPAAAGKPAGQKIYKMEPWTAPRK